MASGTIPFKKPIVIERSKSSNSTPLDIDLSGYSECSFLMTLAPALDIDYAAVFFGHVRVGATSGNYVVELGHGGSHTPTVSITSTGILTLGTTASYTAVRILIF